MSTKVIISLIVEKLQVKGCMIRPKDVIAKMRTNHGIQILYNKAWKAEEYVERLAYSESLHSFQKLPSYLCMLEQNKSKHSDETKY